ncbi:HAD family hydrolase [Aestuariibius insulae]|uniref:HAD family hydrolase n=1 Tax=Aestuariibius insulae TaxID=2058287 RepID=UPI00345EE274
MGKLETIGFDADDTLWHNERVFRLTQERFANLLAGHADRERLEAELLDAETRNLAHYGYGVKGFVLSMIETAIEVTDKTVPAGVIAELLEAGRDMLDHPIELLPHAKDAVGALSKRYDLLLITKGDLLDQERKLAQSGLGELFDGVEIVSEKTTASYRAIFDRHGVAAKHSMMVGNSMKSDVLPVIEAGGWGTHVPSDLEWDWEHAPAPEGHPRFHVLEDLGGLADLVSTIS